MLRTTQEFGDKFIRPQRVRYGCMRCKVLLSETKRCIWTLTLPACSTALATRRTGTADTFNIRDHLPTPPPPSLCSCRRGCSDACGCSSACGLRVERDAYDPTQYLPTSYIPGTAILTKEDQLAKSKRASVASIDPAMAARLAEGAAAQPQDADNQDIADNHPADEQNDEQAQPPAAEQNPNANANAQEQEHPHDVV